MKKDLLIRADGSTKIGLGHLIRCISLGQILKEDYNIEFICREIPKEIESELRDESFCLRRINSETSFFSRLNKNTTVVLDGYHFDYKYQRKIRDSGAKLVIIDDLHDRTFCANMIINHAPGVNKIDYLSTPDTIFALGPDFALLRSSFQQAAEKHRKVRDNSTVLICFGGSDVKNLTQTVYEVVSGFGQFKKINIVTGAAYKFQKQLFERVGEDNRVDFHHAIDENKMLELMLSSGVAFVPCSGILFEALACGNICVSGTYNQNQEQVYKGFKDLDAIIDAGAFEKADIEKAIEQIGEFHIEKVIDGKSPKRIRNLFKKL